MKRTVLLVVTALLMTASPVMAQSPDCLPPGTGAVNDIGVQTAIGCLNAGNSYVLIGQILGWSTILGGTIAFLMAIFAGFQIATAAGDPKRMKAAQELLTSALSGLMLIVFSIFLVNLIGFKILNLGPLGLPPATP